MTLPDDMFKQELLPYLTVDDIVNIPSTPTNGLAQSNNDVQESESEMKVSSIVKNSCCIVLLLMRIIMIRFV